MKLSNECKVKFSLIIPVYNAEQYIERCVDSIKQLVETNFECIIINDGSTDRSKEILNELVETDKRFIIHHKDNGGVSSARNLGLEYAQGEYIVFVDADDFLSPDFLNIEEEFQYYDIIQKPFRTIIHDNDNEDVVMNTTPVFASEVTDDIYRFFARNQTNALWNKIISRKIIEKRRFNTNVKVGEDFLFFISILPYSQSYAVSHIGYYNYFVHKESTMLLTNKDIHKRMDIICKNIANIRNIINGNIPNISKFISLTECIIYNVYYPILVSNQKILDDEGKNIAKRLTKEFKWKKLEYCCLQTKFKISFLVYKNHFPFK